MEILLKMTNLRTEKVGYIKNPALAIIFAQVAMDKGSIEGCDPYRIELVIMSEENADKIPEGRWGRP